MPDRATSGEDRATTGSAVPWVRDDRLAGVFGDGRRLPDRPALDETTGRLALGREVDEMSGQEEYLPERSASPPRRTPATSDALEAAPAPSRPAGPGARYLAVPPDGGASMLRLQRDAGNTAVSRLIDEESVDAAGSSSVLSVIGQGGAPLEPGVRSAMEAGLGADFGDVRVHTDAPAAASARSVQARAYTVGNDVVFGEGAYRPDSHDGQRTLAHELSHVIQQRQGPVEGSPAGDGLLLSDPSDRFEQAAEASAERFTSATGAGGGELAAERDEASGELGELGLQRQLGEDEEDEDQPMG
ncbi:MAG: DUF4157 domain-containing protein [Acidimicrobiales bacterium]|jgi:hypothetical protein